MSPYQRDGYEIIKAPWIADVKNTLRSDLLAAARFVVEKISPDIFTAAAGCDSLTEFLSTCHHLDTHNEVISRCYEVFPALPTTIALVNNANILKLMRDFGISRPFPGTLPLVRLDRPKNTYFLTPAHQDIWYSMLCDNAAVLWCTLDDITEDMGFLKVIPGSHKNGPLAFRVYETGYEPFVPVEDFEEPEKWLEVKTADDELLIFSQMLVHKSGINRSERMRVSVQMRYNDLATAKKMTSTFVPKHSVYVQKMQEEALARSRG